MVWLLSLILASVTLVRADVYPYYPAGDVIRSGQVCAIKWNGDTASTTAWKDMAIELMTGNNYNMIHLTTVATGLDGTVNGGFNWTCPEVIPNADIYFYQFRSPYTPDYVWTTRFTIASDTGATSPPPNDTQPDGQKIGWGNGQLADPSIATPPPTFPSTTTTSTGPAATATPTNVAPGVQPGCFDFLTETNLLCYQIVQQYNISLNDFETWNGGSNVCNVLQTGLAYCIGGRPSNALPAAVSSCTEFFTETNLLCYQIAAQYNITVAQFETWNGGSNVCNVLQSGIAYCVQAPTSTSSSVPTPTNAAPGIVAGCQQWYTETNTLCYQIAANFNITVNQFESWNGANSCNVLQTGLAYCVLGP